MKNEFKYWYYRYRGFLVVTLSIVGMMLFVMWAGLKDLGKTEYQVTCPALYEGGQDLSFTTNRCRMSSGAMHFGDGNKTTRLCTCDKIK